MEGRVTLKMRKKGAIRDEKLIVSKGGKKCRNK